MPNLNTNIKAFNSYIELSKLPNLYFVAHTCIYILFLPEQWKHYPKLTHLFLYHVLIGTHSNNSLYLQLTDEEAMTRNDRMEKI